MITETEKDYIPIQWESLQDLANRIPFSYDWCHENVNSGKIPGYKIKGRWLLNPKEVDEALKKMGIQTTGNIDLKKHGEKLVEKGLRLLKNPDRGGKTVFRNTLGGEHGV